MIKRKLIMIMENKPGALVRVVGLFHQRGYNIETLHVDPVTDFSRYKFIEEKLETKFKENEISSDGNSSWMEVECLGACLNAPMIQTNDEYYEDLDEKKLENIIEQTMKGKTPKPGSYRGRVNSEPENNRTTLVGIKNA